MAERAPRALRVLSVFGTRPEAVKMAPVVLRLSQTPGVEARVCVTAQHREMLDQPLQLFGSIKPDYDLDIMLPGQTIPEVTARAVSGLDPVIAKEQPDAVLVQGDTTTVLQAEGNPFYAEELLNYLHDRDVDLRDEVALEKLELPSSLHRLILSRIDQLASHQQLTLKVASIIGRRFEFNHLYNYYPTLGIKDQVKVDLQVLERLDITPLETPEPELTYLFKHLVTHEVGYESIAFSQRAQLHGQ